MLPNMTGDCSPQMFALNVPGFILHLHFKHVAVKQTEEMESLGLQTPIHYTCHM